MDFLNKAVEKHTGGNSSSTDNAATKNDSTFSKAMEAAEKYNAKDKAVEYAQKQVAKRGEPGYVDKTDKSSVDKAIEAGEDFLAKQGQPKH